MARFGTDGVRGRAHEELTLDLAYRIGRAAAVVLGGPGAAVGRDPRESGPQVAAAVAAGLASQGVIPLDLGVAPTPAVAASARRREVPGVMISASHNPWYDNGIKLFGASGSKLSDAEQDAIEAEIEAGSQGGYHIDDPATPLESIQADVGLWVDEVLATFDATVDRLSLVVDMANGAASHMVGPGLADLGFEVEVINDRPDGRNINDRCGSTHPDGLAEAVVAKGADLGVAFDGDADRLVCVDHRGAIVDGDQIMAILACDLRDRGRLRDDVVVATVMSNLGFHRAMQAAGIRVEVTPVGDRHILEALATHRWSFGGEQSGHLIFADLATTGDGFLSAVQLIAAIARSGRSLADLADDSMVRFPQILRNVTVAERTEAVTDQLSDEISAATERLGESGRVLIRASGTEPVVRVMVEAEDGNLASAVCDDLCQAVVDRFGA